MPARTNPAYPTPAPLQAVGGGGISPDVIAVHLSYLVAQVTALVPKVDALHDASVRRDSEIRSLRSDMRETHKALDEHSDLHKAHIAHLKKHCDEIDDLNDVVAAPSKDDSEPKSWVGKIGAKAIDAVIPTLVTILLFGAMAGWTGVRMHWGNPVQPAVDAEKPAAQGAK